MKNYLFLFSFWLIAVLLFSCKKNSRSASVITSDTPLKTLPSTPNSITPDFDPYFASSNDTTAHYGPSSITRNILEDHKGNIWLATWEGIIRYNPETKIFTNLTIQKGLRPFHVFCLLEDSKGILWFGTIGAGVYKYHPSDDTFTNITTTEGLVFDGIGCIFEDKNNNIWFGTQEGLSCLKADQRNLKKDQITFQNFTTEEGLTDNDINSIIEDPAGNLWIGTRGEACTYDGQTFTKIVSHEGKTFQNVRSIIMDKAANIWLGGNNGLWRVKEGFFSQLTTDFVGYIFEDHKGNIWTSAVAPLNRHIWVIAYYDAKNLSAEKPISNTLIREGNMFFGITEDRDGAIWFGSLKGASRYDGTSFNNFQPAESQN